MKKPSLMPKNGCHVYEYVLVKRIRISQRKRKTKKRTIKQQPCSIMLYFVAFLV